MVRFDSSTQTLVLQKSASLDGVGVKTDPILLPFDHLDEPARQVAITVAKLVTTYANGGALNKTRKSKDSNGNLIELPSLVDEFKALLSRLYPDVSVEKDQSPIGDGPTVTEQQS